MVFSKVLIDWYLKNKRELPWRKTSDPYHIWLSEIMLQQTRIEQGLPYYQRFISAFPSVFDHASSLFSRVFDHFTTTLRIFKRMKGVHTNAFF